MEKKEKCEQFCVGKSVLSGLILQTINRCLVLLKIIRNSINMVLSFLETILGFLEIEINVQCVGTLKVLVTTVLDKILTLFFSKKVRLDSSCG